MIRMMHPYDYIFILYITGWGGGGGGIGERVVLGGGEGGRVGNFGVGVGFMLGPLGKL